MKIKVAIVEDQKTIRELLYQMVEQSEECECVSLCSNGMEAIDQLPLAQPNVVLMDIHMPGINGIEVIKKLRSKMPNTQFLMCTIYEEEDHIFESLQSGATGYIVKNTPADEMIAAIKDIYRGGSPMSSVIARKVISSFQPSKTENTDYNLTEREWEVLQSLARGLRYKEIAESQFVTIDTIRTHVRNIYKKLEVKTRTEAVNAAFGKGRFA